MSEYYKNKKSGNIFELVGDALYAADDYTFRFQEHLAVYRNVNAPDQLIVRKKEDFNKDFTLIKTFDSAEAIKRLLTGKHVNRICNINLFKYITLDKNKKHIIVSDPNMGNDHFNDEDIFATDWFEVC